MIRNAKFWGLEYSAEFSEMLTLTNSLLNEISECVRDEISNGSKGSPSYSSMKIPPFG